MNRCIVSINDPIFIVVKLKRKSHWRQLLGANADALSRVIHVEAVWMHTNSARSSHRWARHFTWLNF